MEEIRNYTVYMHVNKINDKKYIGISSNLKRRWECQGKQYKYYFGNAIQKYGWNNFEHKILFEGLTKNEACELEKQLILEFKTNDKEFGYNICTGGEGVNRGFSHIFKYDLEGDFICEYNSIIDVAKDLDIKSTQYSLIYACCNGEYETAFGYQWAYIYLGNKIDSVKSSQQRVNESKYKTVYQYSMDGKYIGKFQSVKEVIEKLGTNPGACLNGLNCTSGGYQWFYDYKGCNIPPIIPPNEKTRNRLMKKVYVFDKNKKLLKEINSKKEAMNQFNVSQKKFDKIIKNTELYNDKYYISYKKEI